MGESTGMTSSPPRPITVRLIELSEHTVKLSWAQPFQGREISRFVERYGPDKFAMLAFDRLVLGAV